LEALRGLERDRTQRHDLITAQLRERQNLQVQFCAIRQAHTKQLAQLHKDVAANRKPGPQHKPFRETLRGKVCEAQPKPATKTLHNIRPPQQKALTPADRLQRLRSGEPRSGPSHSKGPDLER